MHKAFGGTAVAIFVRHLQAPGRGVTLARMGANRVVSMPTAVLGVVLGALMAGAAVVRRSKPVHPRGSVVAAELEITAAVPELGQALGTPGRHAAVARFSRGGGLPDGWPDIQGVALRWQGPTGDQDVLLATTGTGPVGRYVLRLHRRALSGTFTSLLPYRGPRGPVLLSAEPDGARMLMLGWARPRGEWSTFGTLRLLEDPGATVDRAVRFDPVLNAPTGLTSYRSWRRLRLPAYRWSRRAWAVSETPRPAALRS